MILDEVCTLEVGQRRFQSIELPRDAASSFASNPRSCLRDCPQVFGQDSSFSRISVLIHRRPPIFVNPVGSNPSMSSTLFPVSIFSSRIHSISFRALRSQSRTLSSVLGDFLIGSSMGFWLLETIRSRPLDQLPSAQRFLFKSTGDLSTAQSFSVVIDMRPSSYSKRLSILPLTRGFLV
jgi:hypothetical protein